MRRQFLPALGMLLVFTVLTGIMYPLMLTGLGQALFHDRANGSLVESDGRIVGSRWIGQPFSKPGYFHPRPSAAGDGYDGGASSGSNSGPTNPDFLQQVTERAVAYRAENGLAADADVPVDAVTASASGLDPHISIANARLQAARVADARGLAVDDVLVIVEHNTDERDLGFLGEPGVNVLQLNIDLDAIGDN